MTDSIVSDVIAEVREKIIDFYGKTNVEPTHIYLGQKEIAELGKEDAGYGRWFEVCKDGESVLGLKVVRCCHESFIGVGI